MPSETLTHPDAGRASGRCRSSARRDALLRRQRADGHWVFELEADATIPAEYVLLEHYLDRIDPELRGEDRRLSARDPGRAWRLAAVPRRRLRPLRQREGLFRAQDRSATTRRAAHGARPRRHPGRRRGGAHQRLHPRPARAVRPGAVARGAGHAGRDHASAALVLLPPVEGVVLVAHGDRAAAGADGAAPARAQSARRRMCAELFRTPPEQVRDWIRGPYRSRWGARLQGARRGAARSRTRSSRALAPQERDPQAPSPSSPSG